MASQIDTTREYTNVDESSSPRKVKCTLCKVNIVPKGITSTRGIPVGEKHCPNCGKVLTTWRKI